MPMNINNVADRAFIFIEASRQSSANAEARTVDPDTGGEDTFEVPMTDGSGQTTHYGCNTALTSKGKQQIQTLDAARSWSTVYWKSDGWDWDSALSDAGLQENRPDDDT